MNNSTKINLELINGSIETLSGVESLVNSFDLLEGFDDLESYLRKINFEHTNCVDYKDSFNIIYDNISDIKNKISKLVETLKQIKSSYSDIENITSNDLKEISDIYKDTPASEQLRKIASENVTDIKNVVKKTLASSSENSNVTVIPPVSETETSIEEKPYSTVPIGLAIGATGIAGSVGAVIVNEKYGPEIAESEIENYYDVTDDKSDFEVEDDYPKKEEIENIEPYHASRETREAEKYYGNENNDLSLDDYDEEEVDNKYDE